MPETYALVWLCSNCCDDDPKFMQGQTLTPNYDIETGDGIHDFDKSQCDRCGERLAGVRYRYALWSPEPVVGEMVPCPEHDGNFDCTPFCFFCEGKQEYKYTGYLPCKTCFTPVPDDIWREELGYCQPCQADYFDGTEYENDAFIDTPTREDNN